MPELTPEAVRYVIDQSDYAFDPRDPVSALILHYEHRIADLIECAQKYKAELIRVKGEWLAMQELIYLIDLFIDRDGIPLALRERWGESFHTVDFERAMGLIPSLKGDPDDR